MDWKEHWTTDDIQRITEVRTADGAEWILFAEREGLFIATRKTAPKTTSLWKHCAGKSWVRYSLDAALNPEGYPVNDEAAEHVEVVAVRVKN